MDIESVFQVMMQLFLIMILGFGLNKAKILDAGTNKKLSALIVCVTAPMLTIASMSAAESGKRAEILLVIGYGFLFYIGLILVGYFLSWLFRFPKKDRPVYECMLVFANCSFMGFPVLQAVLGTEAIFYSAMFHFSFNLLIFSYAILRLTSEEKGAGDFKAHWKEYLKMMLNPGMLMTLLALVIYLTGIPIRGFVYDTVYMVGNVTAPLSMLVMGATLAEYPLKESILDYRCYIFSILRLILMPLAAYLVCVLFHVSEMFTGIITITTAMPVASMVLMMSTEYGGDTKLVIRNIFVTTTLSVLTIPCVIWAMTNLL